jgi:DnaJ-class molecular chaperone
MATFYEVLGVDEHADDKAIAEAFRRLAKVYHPDAPTGDTERFKNINEAYHVLKDHYKRVAYDFQLSLAAEAAQQKHETASAYQVIFNIAVSLMLAIFGVYCFMLGDTGNEETYNGYIVLLGWVACAVFVNRKYRL